MENKSMIPPRGLICPVITPLEKGNRLDLHSLEKLLNHVIKAVDGILLGDVLWGESLGLSKRIRLELVISSLEMIGGRVPAFVTITGNTIKETHMFMAEVESFVDRVQYPGHLFWVDYPLCYHGNRDLPQLYRNWIEESKRPFIIGNIPELVKQRKAPGRHYNIRTSVFKKTVRNFGIEGVIFYGDLKRANHYLKAVRFRDNFTFYDGDEAVFLKNPGLGGLIAGGSNLIPNAWFKITRSSLNRYDTERQFHAHQTSIWETGMMAHSLYSLYKTAPVCNMKKILKEAGLINNSLAISVVKNDRVKWKENVKHFFDSYDILS